MRFCLYLGMVGLFTAVNRTPLTAILVTYELTGTVKERLRGDDLDWSEEEVFVLVGARQYS